MKKRGLGLRILCATLVSSVALAQEQRAMNLDAKIYVAGHKGLVGSAIVRRLQHEGYTNIIVHTSDELDLRDQKAVNVFFEQEHPEYVFLAAARVGGIKANWEQPAQFIYDNLLISANIIHASYVHGVKKLLFLGSSCIYPRECPQPIKEEYLLTGPLEITNDAYAVAKIAGIKMCQSYNRQYGTNFISCMPTNLYGPYDNFDLNSSHVLPALIAKFHAAKRDHKSEVVIWGSGTPYREFLYVDDLADAVLHLMRAYSGSEIVNIGTGRDNTILEVAKIIQEVVGFKGSLTFDATKPDGTPRKLLNVDRLKNLGWQAPTTLRDGIEKTYAWCLQNNIFDK